MGKKSKAPSVRILRLFDDSNGPQYDENVEILAEYHYAIPMFVTLDYANYIDAINDFHEILTYANITRARFYATCQGCKELVYEWVRDTSPKEQGT
jgi:hypothetical protein